VKEAIRADEERRREELDLFNIQPKKPNWDLKRDLEKRLEKIKPKTEAAINTLIRENMTTRL
jgi:coiled-coil domain-containing protein 12